LREGMCRSFCRIDAVPSITDHIDCRVEIVQIASLSMARAAGTSGRFLRTRDLLSDSCDDLALVSATSGDVFAGQEGRSVALRQSEMCLLDMSLQCEVVLDDGNQFAVTRIPRRELLSICPRAEDMLSKPLQHDPAIRELIERYFALSVGAAASLDVVGQQLTARHMIDLVALLLRTGHNDTRLALQRGYSAARLQVIQAQVLENLEDSNLTIASIAARSNASPKQVQRLFEAAGTTFTEFVLEQGLLSARRLLSSAGNRQDKIGTIAYAAGFGDLSYFNRGFGRRFGVTPSEWRAAQLS
jgi:AraC-like DNA-binding protein